VITWVFDEDSFSPVAKLRADKKYSILSDYLGTPTHVFNDGGEVIWEAALDSYGKLRVEKGTLGSCPFRYQGQYEDVETNLYYNRFRYYSPEEGGYISQDPIGLKSGELGFYNYVCDPNNWLDIYGLVPTYKLSRKKFRKHVEMVENAVKKGHSLKGLKRGKGTKAASKNRYESQKDIRKKQGGPKKNHDYDEFPYASTEQGGKGAHVQEVLSDVNQGAGRDLGKFYRENNIKHGDIFDIEIVD
jgi:RHS repeat-associated protein